MNRRVYLAGPITGLSYDDSVDWRSQVIFELDKVNIKGISPLRAKDYLKNEKAVADHYPESPLSCIKGITTRDRHDVLTCDVVFANFLGAKKASLGTCIELGWADGARKPIIVCMEKDNVHNHALVNGVAGFIVNNIYDGIEIVKALLI